MCASETTRVCDIEVTNRKGIHIRVAAMICKEMKGFSSSASLTHKKTGQTADCRCALDLLTLFAECGDVLALSVNGPDADELQTALITLLASNFPEDEYEETKS